MSRGPDARSNRSVVVSYAERPAHRRVHLVTRRSHHLLTLSASLLAVAVAAGVATPRPRLGREWALRMVALAACARPDQPRAWGSADDPEADIAVAAGSAFASEGLEETPADAAAALSRWGFVAKVSTAWLVPPPEDVAAANARSGPPPGRAPPVVGS